MTMTPWARMTRRKRERMAAVEAVVVVVVAAGLQVALQGEVGPQRESLAECQCQAASLLVVEVVSVACGQRQPRSITEEVS